MAHPLKSTKAHSLTGHVRVPGDKSISHRALILGALSSGQTKITGLLESDDVLATANALQNLGAVITKMDDCYNVTGCGTGGLCPSSPDISVALDFGNSGTGSRLMMGVVAGHDICAQFQGDDSLSRRPMGRVLKPLKRMGLNISETDKDTFPLTLKGNSDLIPITYELPVASAQVKSAVLLAGLMTEGQTCVIEPARTRDHTERMLAYFGAKLDIISRDHGRMITLHGPAELHGKDIVVPSDPSSAAFLTAAALLCPDSDITVKGVLINPTRFGFYQTLLEMGAHIELENERMEGGEPVADLRVMSSRLHGVDVPAERAPSMIDEYPCLAVVAAFATGETKMHGLSELRVKECDRLSVTAAGLQACGIPHLIKGDDLYVQGQDQVRGGAVIHTELDHRIAMSFLVLGLATEEPITVDDITMIATSFPQFIDLIQSLGARFEESKT
ncbi:MAG: 3-phosphoshikimate 1-carboxyvinyltransferase [Pseudomonadota bacterium]